MLRNNRFRWRTLHRPFLIFVLLAFVPGAGLGLAQTQAQVDLTSKRVLILHSFAYAQPVYKIIDQSLEDSFVSSGLNFNNLYFEFLDLARNPSQEYRHKKAEIFRNEFRERKLDLVLTLHQEALHFLLKEGQDVYPEGPIFSILGDSTFSEHFDLKRPLIHLPFTIDVISQTIIKAHGGTIEARNNREGGATFAFTLPVHQGDLP